MAEVDLEIGGRYFKIVCADGEEGSLKSAATLLDNEARLVINQVGRVPETRLLLMAGLMLADRMVLMEAEAVPVREPKKTSDGLSEELRRALLEAAQRAEALADEAEAMLESEDD